MVFIPVSMDFGITLTVFGRKTQKIIRVDDLCEKNDTFRKITGQFTVKYDNFTIFLQCIQPNNQLSSKNA